MCQILYLDTQKQQKASSESIQALTTLAKVCTKSHASKGPSSNEKKKSVKKPTKLIPSAPASKETIPGQSNPLPSTLPNKSYFCAKKEGKRKKRSIHQACQASQI